jgi:hypothetical protein
MCVRYRYEYYTEPVDIVYRKWMAPLEEVFLSRVDLKVKEPTRTGLSALVSVPWEHGGNCRRLF